MEKEPNWIPGNMKLKGLHHRIFTDEEEKNISEFIRTNYIKPGFFFNDSLFRKIAIMAFLEKKPKFRGHKRFSM